MTDEHSADLVCSRCGRSPTSARDLRRWVAVDNAEPAVCPGCRTPSDEPLLTLDEAAIDAARDERAREEEWRDG